MLVVLSFLGCRGSRNQVPPPITSVGTVIGKTPVIGLILICTDGKNVWQHESLVKPDNVLDWPPNEVCQ